MISAYDNATHANLPVSVTPSPERAAEKGWMWVGSADPINPECTADDQLNVRSRSHGTDGTAVVQLHRVHQLSSAVAYNEMHSNPSLRYGFL